MAIILSNKEDIVQEECPDCLSSFALKMKSLQEESYKISLKRAALRFNRDDSDTDATVAAAAELDRQRNFPRAFRASDWIYPRLFRQKIPEPSELSPSEDQESFDPKLIQRVVDIRMVTDEAVSRMRQKLADATTNLHQMQLKANEFARQQQYVSSVREEVNEKEKVISEGMSELYNLERKLSNKELQLTSLLRETKQLEEAIVASVAKRKAKIPEAI
eukprot:GHVR01149445.1.p1 GENE.GHVR01149445.1~~GHVR01149445.1.p1  ORF type:complete len:218 (-),score=30.87 GHVR01149445.1:260-913(-)